MSQTQAERDAQMDKFLATGGKIQQVATNVSGRAEGKFSAWGAPKKAGRKPVDTTVVNSEEEVDI